MATHPRARTEVPAPDDPRKPDAPQEIEKPSWGYVFRKTLHEFTSDQCTDLGAGLTFYAVLSIFPGLIVLASLLGVFGQGEESTGAILSMVKDVAPESTVSALRGPLQQLTQTPAAGFALIAGIVIGIWSASRYVTGFSRAMNRIYEVEEGRPFWKLKPIQLLVTVIAIVLILIMTVILVVSGPVTDAIGSALGIGDTAKTVWSFVKWPVLALAVVLIIAILYYAAPNVKQPKFRWMSMGALMALITLVIASFGFGLYIANFSNYDRTFGSLAGVIVFLLWLWIANLALLFGAEFDAELERGRELQAGMPAEEEIRLPPRDTTKSEKAAERHEKDLAEGRRIRENH